MKVVEMRAQNYLNIQRKVQNKMQNKVFIEII